MTVFLVTDGMASPETMSDEVFFACYVEADTPEAAAAEGMARLWERWIEESGGRTDPEPPHDVWVIDASGRTRYRALMGAEKVPDEFQCCGGWPAFPMGTEDRHTATCRNRPTEVETKRRIKMNPNEYDDDAFTEASNEALATGLANDLRAWWEAGASEQNIADEIRNVIENVDLDGFDAETFYVAIRR